MLKNEFMGCSNGCLLVTSSHQGGRTTASLYVPVQKHGKCIHLVIPVTMGTFCDNIRNSGNTSRILDLNTRISDFSGEVDRFGIILRYTDGSRLCNDDECVKTVTKNIDDDPESGTTLVGLDVNCSILLEFEMNVLTGIYAVVQNGQDESKVLCLLRGSANFERTNTLKCVGTGGHFRMRDFYI